MFMQERTLLILDILNGLYDSESSLLDYDSAFQLAIAVTLSAQTTDKQVNKVTPELFSRFPDAASLMVADFDEVCEIIRSTGFFRNKAKNIIKAARLIHEEFGGKMPETIEDLVRIPGMGRKSAGVVLHHIYNKPAIIVDTHFGRVVSRLGLTESKDPVKIEKDIAAEVDQARWSEFSMTANLHGRAICHSRKPDCTHCPLNKLCPSGDIFTAARTAESINA